MLLMAGSDIRATGGRVSTMHFLNPLRGFLSTVSGGAAQQYLKISEYYSSIFIIIIYI